MNPFTGAYPPGFGARRPNDHTGHTHTGTSHRILVEMSDLNTTLNPGRDLLCRSAIRHAARICLVPGASRAMQHV